MTAVKQTGMYVPAYREGTKRVKVVKVTVTEFNDGSLRITNQEAVFYPNHKHRIMQHHQVKAQMTDTLRDAYLKVRKVLKRIDNGRRS